jgi:hypothetical protein
MNADSSPKIDATFVRNEDRGHQRALSENPQDDFALVQLDTTFVTLLAEIYAAEPKHECGIGRLRREHRENVRPDEASETRKIESVLGRLEPVEWAIMATPARTIVGLGIKARHAAYVVSEHWDAPIEQIDWDARVVRLLIEAVCKAAGVRLPFPAEAGQ